MDNFAPFLFILFPFLILIVRGYTVLLHELGHAITAAYLSGEKVKVYVGSYGEQVDTRHWKWGLIECYLKKNASWDRGLCVPESKNFTLNGQILYTAMGPVVTVFCALIFGLIAYSTVIPNWIRVLSGLLSFITLIDALRSLIPSKRPILMANDGITYNDGQLLRNLFNHKRLNSKFKEVEIATNQKDYERAGDLLLAAIPKAKNKTELYRYAASLFTEGKHLEKAAISFTGLEKEGGMDANDYNNAGLICAYLQQYEKALTYFEKAVALQADHHLALTNRAFTHLMLEHYDTAHSLFDQLFQKDPENAYLLTNRGLAAAKNGRTADGLQDMERALQMDPEESYAHRNLGIYFLDQGNGVEALKYLKTAHKINPQTHLMDALLEKAEAS
jgi:tetratricopeptide (TPR) repeat protein